MISSSFQSELIHLQKINTERSSKINIYNAKNLTKLFFCKISEFFFNEISTYLKFTHKLIVIDKSFQRRNFSPVS